MQDRKEIAFRFAQERHQGQLDDCGRDYFIAHILQVAKIVECITPDEDTIITAYLHDTLEDTKTRPEEIELRFGKKVKDLVLEMTHDGKKDNVGFYFPRLKSKEAIIVKFADRLSNISRMESWDKERQAQYLKKSKFWKSTKEK